MAANLPVPAASPFRLQIPTQLPDSKIAHYVVLESEWRMSPHINDGLHEVCKKTEKSARISGSVLASEDTEETPGQISD